MSVLEIVKEEVIELLEGLGRTAEVTASTRLYGAEGLLDSMGLVMLIAEIERRVEEDLGRSISLADDRAMSANDSPFESVGRLAAYVEGLLDR